MSTQDTRARSRFQFGLMWTRMKKVSRFDRTEVLELKENKTAMGQAIAILVFSSLSVGVGQTLLAENPNNISAYGIIVGGLGGIIVGGFAALVWSGMLFLVGTKLFQGKTSFWELARPMFFSLSPALLFILVAIPVPILYKTVAIVISAWIIGSQGFVLKQVMGIDLRRTVLTFAVAFMILLFIYLQFA
jgi:hypothetical protein